MPRLSRAAAILTASFLLLIIVATVSVSAASAASAPVSPVVQLEPPSQQQGKDLSRSDWVDHLPVLAGCVLLVVVVDAVVITKIVRDRRRRLNLRGQGPRNRP